MIVGYWNVNKSESFGEIFNDRKPEEMPDILALAEVKPYTYKEGMTVKFTSKCNDAPTYKVFKRDISAISQDSLAILIKTDVLQNNKIDYIYYSKDGEKHKKVRTIKVNDKVIEFVHFPSPKHIDGKIDYTAIEKRINDFKDNNNFLFFGDFNLDLKNVNREKEKELTKRLYDKLSSKYKLIYSNNIEYTFKNKKFNSNLYIDYGFILKNVDCKVKYYNFIDYISDHRYVEISF